MTNVVPHTGEVASLGVARAKLANVIELYTPHNAIRDTALEAFGRALIEYEAAVREDERAKVGDAVATAQAEAIDTQAAAHADRVRALAAEEALARGPVDMSPPPPAPISADGAVDANGSPVPDVAVAEAAMTPAQREAHAETGIGIVPPAVGEAMATQEQEKPARRKK